MAREPARKVPQILFKLLHIVAPAFKHSEIYVQLQANVRVTFSAILINIYK